MKNNLVYFVFLIVLSSCSVENDRLNTNVIDLPFEEMIIEPFIGKPYQIAALDSFLVLADNWDEKSLLVYNLNNNSYKRCITLGQGPHDVITPIDFDVYKSELIILQRRTGECRVYNMAKLFHNNEIEYQKIYLKNADRCCKTDEGYMFLGYNDSSIFSFLDNRDSLFVSVDFNDFSVKDASVKYKLLQGNIAYSVQDKVLIYVPYFSSFIKFYSYNGNKWSVNKTVQIGENKIENRILEKQRLDIFDDDKRFCLDVCVMHDNFYVLYDGQNMGQKETAKFRYILKYKSNGEYVCSYRVNPTITNICILNNTVYALMLSEKDGEYVIGKAILK